MSCLSPSEKKRKQFEEIKQNVLKKTTLTNDEKHPPLKKWKRLNRPDYDVLVHSGIMPRQIEAWLSSDGEGLDRVNTEVCAARVRMDNRPSRRMDGKKAFLHSGNE